MKPKDNVVDFSSYKKDAAYHFIHMNYLKTVAQMKRKRKSSSVKYFYRLHVGC